MSEIRGHSAPGVSERRDTERRSRLSRTHWPEQRTGFDRRREYVITSHLRERASLVIVMAIALNLLNLLDLAFTTAGFSVGVTEANPVMRGAFELGWLPAAAFKISMMIVVTAIIWFGRKYRRVLQVGIVAVGVYAALIVYHVVGLTLTV